MRDNWMTYSKSGLSFTECFEGCSLEAYQDSGGVWTIGYGHTGPTVKKGSTITKFQAEVYLVQDIMSASTTVNHLVNVPLTQGQFDALVDFVFNVGRGAFVESTLLSKLNQGDLDGAAAEFDKWDHVGGKIVAGLLRRRQAETEEFKC